MIGAVLVIVPVLVITLYVMQHNRRKTAHALETAALQNTFENQLLQARLEAQEQSFAYFSEEIHDNVGQILSVVGMQLYRIQDMCADPGGKRLARHSTELLNKAINDLRSISHTFHAGHNSKAGLVESLQRELAYLNMVKSADCRLEVHGPVRELGASRQMLLFRIIQEAIMQSLKQAHASVVILSLYYTGTTLTAVLRDDGQPAQPAAGRGTSNMQLRARLLGGTLEHHSHPGTGTTLTLAIDIHEK